MNKKILIMTMLFFLNITSISAECTQDDKKSFKKVEDDYKVTYEYNKESEMYDVYFNATKPKEFYYEIFADNDFSCTKINDTTNKCSSFPAGQYEVLIVGVTESCDDVLKTIKLKLPKYNKLSEDPLCEGIEEFVLCNPGYEKDIDYESFVSRVNTYKKNKKDETKETPTTNEEEPKEHNEQLNKIINFFKNNLIEIVVITSFVILATITIIINVKTMRKRRRLE